MSVIESIKITNPGMVIRQIIKQPVLKSPFACKCKVFADKKRNNYGNKRLGGIMSPSWIAR